MIYFKTKTSIDIKKFLISNCYPYPVYHTTYYIQKNMSKYINVGTTGHVDHCKSYLKSFIN